MRRVAGFPDAELPDSIGRLARLRVGPCLRRRLYVMCSVSRRVCVHVKRAKACVRARG